MIKTTRSRRGIIHWQGDVCRRTLCGIRLADAPPFAPSTTDMEQVTCKRCRHKDRLLKRAAR